MDWARPQGGESIRLSRDYAILEELKVSNMARGKSFEREVRFRKGLGSTYGYFLDRMIPLENADGVIARWYCISSDIHELALKRKKAESSA